MMILIASSSFGGNLDRHKTRSDRSFSIDFDTPQESSADTLNLAPAQRRPRYSLHPASFHDPAPTSVYAIDEHDGVRFSISSFMIVFSRSSNCPRYFVPQRSVKVQRQHPLVRQETRHLAISNLLSKPSTIAVLPTPGSPISTGLFFVRHRIWMTRSTSASRQPTDQAADPSQTASGRAKTPPACSARRAAPCCSATKAPSPVSFAAALLG